MPPRPQIMDEALARLGMPVPDSALARRARELITEVAPPSVVNHEEIAQAPFDS